MIFEGLSNNIQKIVSKLKGQTRVTEKDVKNVMREIKLALLEADVSFKVVKDFIARVSEKASGQEVITSLTPGQQVIKIINDELVELMGSEQSRLTFSTRGITIYMIVGLQGSGKTTTSAKLANVLRKEGKKPLLVACDVYRPAAIKQLQVVGSQLSIPVFTEDTKDVIKIAKDSVEQAKNNGNDLIIIDTAGRLHIDEELMQELINIKGAVVPHEILLVVDSMIGQDAVNVAAMFNEKLGIDGVILTKLDGDTRGGAALSVAAVTKKPIKFIGVGEKLNELEPFHPKRMASRILGMGDVLTLIEKAQESFDISKAEEMEKRIRENQFTLEDFLEQFQQIKRMGSFSKILEMLPGVNAGMLKDVNMDDKKILRIEAIIKSMTKKERLDPDMINASRKKRIADGSGTKIQDVNKLIKDFEEMKKMLKKINSMSKGFMGGKLPKLGFNFGKKKF
ncbi:MAG: signal recognition particle protein [Clostridiales bacterium]|nr:signal recognition particle protein [Clostridiales bacterium]